MSEVLSVKIPKETKKRMKQVPVKWSEVIRHAIEEKIREHERSQAVDAFLATAKNAPRVPEGMTTRLIRKIREES
jgi:hypothetical protein